MEDNGRAGAGSKAFDAAGVFRPTNLQNSICAASSGFKSCGQFVPLPATEWREEVAHGATVGEPVERNFQPQQGRQKINGEEFFRPVRGWIILGRGNPRFHRGLLSAAPPALGNGMGATSP